MFLQNVEISDLFLNLRQMPLCQRSHRTAVTITLIGKDQQASYLIDRETDLACATNKGQPGHIFASVEPIVAARAGKRLKQPDFFVIADGSGRGLRCLGQLSYRKVRDMCLTLKWLQGL